MQRSLFCLLGAMAFYGILSAQQVPEPTDFLGYELGKSFSFHHRVVDYVEAVAGASPKVQLIPYGQTAEGRPLLLAAISTPENLARLDEIRQNNLVSAGLAPGEVKGKSLPVVWFSYNIHGDEAVCTESALACLYQLATGQGDTDKWLKEMVVLIDPCVNPDGRDRYVNWYKQTSASKPNASPLSWEHHQPWPGGRFNHFMFDLNRDWCWQTQPESQARLEQYRRWMPQVMVDFHEMNYESPYFFAPAAKPYHEEISGWQREFQQLVGANHARYFDKNNWLYYTSEVFDLFYPSYGDTWSMFNGAIGFTYEQGGSGQAGRMIAREQGDTLTLNDRLQHHLTTALSTLESTHRNRERLLKEFYHYFNQAELSPPGPYKSFVIKGSNDRGKLEAIMGLLDRLQIDYGFLPENTPTRWLAAFDYFHNSYGRFSAEEGDMVIGMHQPQAHLIKVLFEPHAKLEDSLTYDLTAWSLPYAYGLEAYAAEERLGGLTGSLPEYQAMAISQTPYAILTEWHDLKDVQFLSSLLQAGIKIRMSERPFVLGEKTYESGTLVILRAENGSGFHKKVAKIAEKNEQPLFPIQSGKVEKGRDLGSGSLKAISAPKIAFLGGKGVSPASFGEVWHFFENDLHYPFTLLHTDYFGSLNLDKFDILILPSGEYQPFRDKVLAFVHQGGKLILMEKAITSFSETETQKVNTQLAMDVKALQDKLGKKPIVETPDSRSHSEDGSKRYADRERANLSKSVAGSIYRVSLDDSHPLAFGYSKAMFLIKRNNIVYPYLTTNGWNVGRFGKDSHLSGFVGGELRSKVDGTLAVGLESLGSGSIVYLTDSPIFRGFWHGGKLLMGNAVFF